MKRIKLLGMLALGLLAVNIAATSVNADELIDEKKESKTSVEIIDNKDPDERVLILRSVPSSYDFESTLQNGSYSLTTPLIGQNIVVFNNQLNGDWSVKASVQGNEIQKSASEKFPVTIFKVNSKNILAQGEDAIVAKSGDKDNSNIGDISTEISNVSIDFNDSANILVPGDKLTGTINYQLFNTSDAS